MIQLIDQINCTTIIIESKSYNFCYQGGNREQTQRVHLYQEGINNAPKLSRRSKKLWRTSKTVCMESWNSFTIPILGRTVFSGSFLENQNNPDRQKSQKRCQNQRRTQGVRRNATTKRNETAEKERGRVRELEVGDSNFQMKWNTVRCLYYRLNKS